MSESPGVGDVAAMFPLGVRTPGRARTIAASEISLLAVSSEWTASNPTAQELMEEAGPLKLETHLVLAVVLSLASTNPMFQQLEADRGLVVVAALSHRGAVGAPIHAGDTIITDSEITAARASSSKPDHYVVTVRDVGTNQRGDTVMTVDRVLLFERRR